MEILGDEGKTHIKKCSFSGLTTIKERREVKPPKPMRKKNFYFHTKEKIDQEAVNQNCSFMKYNIDWT